MSLKTGRLSNKEQQFIIDNAQILTTDELANRLGRRPEPIVKFIKENLPHLFNVGETDAKLLDALHGRFYWGTIQDQFSKKEVQNFEKYWIELYKQFNEDVECTEETQIVDLIKLRLLIDRNLYERQKAKQLMERMQESIEIFHKMYDLPPYKELSVAQEYNGLIMESRQIEASYQSRTKEYVDLAQKHMAFLRELKGTRDQRLESIRNSKKDWVALMKTIKEEKARRAEGREIELLNLAADLELKKVTEYHTYEDGTLDRPLLNFESVSLDETGT